MKALFLSDEINQFHWSMLKSVLLILSLLPMSRVLFNVWQDLDASSQIMMGFLGLSVFSAVAIISFYHALNAIVSTLNIEHLSKFDGILVRVYRYMPMLFLASMLSYLATQI